MTAYDLVWPEMLATRSTLGNGLVEICNCLLLPLAPFNLMVLLRPIFSTLGSSRQHRHPRGLRISPMRTPSMKVSILHRQIIAANRNLEMGLASFLSHLIVESPLLLHLHYLTPFRSYINSNHVQLPRATVCKVDNVNKPDFNLLTQSGLCLPDFTSSIWIK